MTEEVATDGEVILKEYQTAPFSGVLVNELVYRDYVKKERAYDEVYNQFLNCQAQLTQCSLTSYDDSFSDSLLYSMTAFAIGVALGVLIVK